MKQAIAIIVVVAILGAIGFEATKTNSSSNLATVATSNIQPASSGNTTTATNTSPAVNYKDGTFTGTSVDNEFGRVEVAAVINGGKITDINFLSMPGGRGHTQEVTSISQPLLKSEAIKAQSANIDFISGATVTSESFERSLQSALNQAVQS